MKELSNQGERLRAQRQMAKHVISSGKSMFKVGQLSRVMEEAADIAAGAAIIAPFALSIVCGLDKSETSPQSPLSP